MVVRLVTFDALFTLIRPRLPIHVQYAHAFEPFFGPLPPDDIKRAFKSALAHLQASRPAYAHGHNAWWADVIRRTALGAGAHQQAVLDALPVLVPDLLDRFSSRRGYALYDDALPTLSALRDAGIITALVSNTDSRTVRVLDDLGALSHLDHVLVSESEGIEKPQPEIFLRACTLAGVLPEQAIHVGDELECDYLGASRAGLHAFLLCRPPDDGVQDTPPTYKDVGQITSLSEVKRLIGNDNI
ncbi:hypothetical protein M0805_006353 [Coniferiporia weirii]|nr:hypothetical protein M0805_006353 [Coniferiporia weirii]